MTKVSALQWLSVAQASRVIENLKQWQHRVINKEVV
ncbi:MULTISPECIES: phage protein GemA/Gp16 family protein [unclassified Pseudomonas]|nr:phage protein GemA/Gp16 family protein [Pseudomonas sp. LAMO17WK12:I9]